MRFIKIEPFVNGGHDNFTVDMEMDIPEGYAVIPDDMETPNFPFGEVTAEEIDGVMTVTSWVAGIVPEPEHIEVEPTANELINSLLGVTSYE